MTAQPGASGSLYEAEQTDFTAQYGPSFPLADALVRRDDAPPKNEPIIKEGYGPD